MSPLRQRARRGLLIQRLAGAAFCALAGGAGLGCLAWAEGLAPALPAAAGALVAFTAASLRFPCLAPAAAELDPVADRDGLLRAALSVDAAHPYRPRLEAEASARPLRFRPLEDGRPLALFAAACLVAAVWMRAEPAFRPGQAPEPTAGPAAGKLGAAPADPSAPVGAAPLAEPAAPPPSAGEGAAAEWWVAPAAPARSPEAVVAGRGGSARGVVDRYLRLRNEEGS